MKDEDAIAAVPETYHSQLHPFVDHGRQWVECLTCGRCWSVYEGTPPHAELVVHGDGFCDDHPRKS